MNQFTLNYSSYFLTSNLSVLQQMPLGFSEVSDTFTAFGSSGFPFSTDPLDSSNDVGQFCNDASTCTDLYALDVFGLDR